MAALYPYQKRVYQHLKNGKNVILQAPTGAGKTLAALYPYFENLVAAGENAPGAASPLPLTCRYAVPMRVLATQFEREYHDYFAKLDRKRGTRFLEQYHERLGINVPAIQTGETPNDPKFESPLTFCTIDQLLASFIGTPYSLSPRLANLNVGAVAGSYLILDEFHLYPLEKTGSGARMTALAMLSMLKGLSPFVMMTATFSTRLLQELGNILHAEIVRVEDQTELDQIMDGRSRTISQVEDVMTPEAILAAHDAARERGAGASLVVCNTVARAQDLYSRLRDALIQHGRREETQLVLLHSRFTPEDRQRKSAQLEAWLGEKQWHDGQFQGSAIVVGTQAVEVGLNISAGVLHTELAPANSLIQRAGRCGRFEKQHGEVIVYRLPKRDDGKVLYRPYPDKLCEQTWEHLEAMIGRDATSAFPFDFEREQDVINVVHGEEDERMLAQFNATEGQTRDAIMKILATHERGKNDELIRNVTQVSVVIHPAPEEAITIKPFRWQSFGLHPGTLEHAWKALEARKATLGDDAPGWIMKQLVDGGGVKEDEQDDNNREPVYTWDTIQPPQIASALRLALPKQLATYDSDLGFRLLLDVNAPSGQWQSEKIKQNTDDQDKKRQNREKQASYITHIKGLINAYRWSVRRELVWLAKRLEPAMQLPPDSIDQAVRLAIACHDIGKLSKGWQTWAHEWQQLLTREKWKGYSLVPGNEFLAKTDRLSPDRAGREEERALQKQLPVKRPNHAYESVLASHEMIAEHLISSIATAPDNSLDALIRATLNAIARHHTPTITSYDAVTWDASIKDAIRDGLVACELPPNLTGLNLTPQQKGNVDTNWLVQPRETEGMGLVVAWLGFTIVRALRLCDQRAEIEL